MLKKLESILMPLAEKIGRNKYLMSIRDGFLISTPLLIVGSFFLLLANFPIPGWNDFFTNILGEGWDGFLAKPVSATFDVMAILAVVGIGYSFSEKLKVDKLFGAVTALVSWLILMPYKVPVKAELAKGGEAIFVNGIPTGWTGAKGIFIGIICAFSAVHIYLSLIHISEPTRPHD